MGVGRTTFCQHFGEALKKLGRETAAILQSPKAATRGLPKDKRGNVCLAEQDDRRP
jgi:hypothetical protein